MSERDIGFMEGSYIEEIDFLEELLLVVFELADHDGGRKGDWPRGSSANGLQNRVRISSSTPSTSWRMSPATSTHPSTHRPR
jgi:hypothetical protein